MQKGYKPLDLNFPFGRSFAHFIIKHDSSLVETLEYAGSKLLCRYRESDKFLDVIQKFMQIGKLIGHPSFQMQENASKADEVIEECFELFSELFKMVPYSRVHMEILHFWSYYTNIDSKKMLEYYYELLLRLKRKVYEIKNDAQAEFYWEMIRLEYNLKYDLMPRVHCVHFLINYMMTLMRDKWSVFKMFKQYHYCLSVCQKVLDAMPASKDGVIIVQQYLHFAWVFYVGRLLDHSSHFRHATVPFVSDNRCITFDIDVQGPDPRFILPNKVIVTEEDRVSLQQNLEILEEDLIYWGNLRICGTLDALDVLESVKNYAAELRF